MGLHTTHAQANRSVGAGRWSRPHRARCRHPIAVERRYYYASAAGLDGPRFDVYGNYWAHCTCQFLILNRLTVLI